MNKAEREHIAKVVALGCCVCSQLGYDDSPAIAHHINSKTMGRKSSHFEVIPLCPRHHQGGGKGVSVHDSLAWFEDNYGTERELLAQVLYQLKGENYG